VFGEGPLVFLASQQRPRLLLVPHLLPHQHFRGPSHVTCIYLPYHSPSLVNFRTSQNVGEKSLVLLRRPPTKHAHIQTQSFTLLRFINTSFISTMHFCQATIGSLQSPLDPFAGNPDVAVGAILSRGEFTVTGCN
jgi:hypothetical protein